MDGKPYGSGGFGVWIEDEFGLPAYRYTCDQANDPQARTPVNEAWRSPTDHTHQIGNDRLVAAASNYGYVQVRQDEGSPKFLNDYDPAQGQYGGGFGYLSDGRLVLSTFCSGDAGSCDRVFGAGYLRKTVSGGPYTVDQVILAPFGDDPLLVSQVTVTNRGDQPAELRWVEYWGCRVYQFSYRATMLAIAGRNLSEAADLRRDLGRRFAHSFEAIPGGYGLLERKRFLGRSLAERLRWGLLQLALATVARRVFGGPVRPPSPQAGLEDLDPPPTFLASLDAPADALSTDAAAFFGAGGPARPDGVLSPLDGSVGGSAQGSGLLLERRFRLEPGEQRTLYLAYGYLPQGVGLEELLSPYREDPAGIWTRSSAAWRADGVRLEIPGRPWVKRETTWHNYYLRSNLTYDSYFRDHILSQGHVYQYIIGFQGAARDPLQHALPFVFSEPRIAREVLRYTLKEVGPDGSIPYGIAGHGMPMPAPFVPSDLELWVLWLASEYVLATRDVAFLAEELRTYPLYGRNAARASVRDLLARCYQHLTKVTGAGEHGLLRLSNGDWNDNAVVGSVPRKHHEVVRRRAESVLNAAMASYVLAHYARLLDYIGCSGAAADARRWAENQAQAVRAQWTGRWFRRAWLGPELGWLGEEPLWLEPQPWAIIGGAATPEQTDQLLSAVDEFLRRPSPIGAMLHSSPLAGMALEPGVLTNGGVWPSITGTLVWALATRDGEMAWDEWCKNTLAAHAEAYPDVWYGIWSGPDAYNSIMSAHPGETQFEAEPAAGVPDAANDLLRGVNWTDYPVMNMHPHAWPLYTAAKLMGVEFTPEGLTLAPMLPLSEYRFSSALLGVARSAEGWEGWYAPLLEGTWQLTLCLPRQKIERYRRLEVNGAGQPIQRTHDGAVAFTGESAPGRPLRWALR